MVFYILFTKTYSPIGIISLRDNVLYKHSSSLMTQSKPDKMRIMYRRQK